MIFQGGLTNHFCFAYICKKDEGENKKKVDSLSGKNLGPLKIHHIKCGDHEVKNLNLIF